MLNKHWANVPIVEDINNVEEIRRIIANSQGKGLYGEECESQLQTGVSGRYNRILLTGGFPCQPFSAAGKRRSSDDSRYLWPQTLAVVQAVKPDWCIFENVAGIVSSIFPDSGTPVASQTNLFEDANDEIADYDTILGRIICDLEQTGYAVQVFIICAAAIGAPHRRDRVWIAANLDSNSASDRCDSRGNNQRWGHIQDIAVGQVAENEQARDGWITRISTGDSHVADTLNTGLQGQQPSESIRLPGQRDREWGNEKPNWSENWYEVATRFCRVDARVPDRVDRLKSLGNAIVPAVAYQLIKAIQEANE